MNKNFRYLSLAIACIGIAAMLTGCGGGGASDKAPADTSATGTPADGTATGAGAHGHDAANDHAHSTRLVFNSEPRMPAVGSPATWTLTVVDTATGKPVEKFATVHDKPLHLIVVSADLTWFNHLHPAYKGAGVFTVAATLPREGAYKLYADYTPDGRSQEVPQVEILTAGMKQKETTAAPVPDTAGAGGWMVKHVTAITEGMPDERGGLEYEVALMPMPGKLVAGRDAMLHFQVRDRSGKPITDLEPYLGAMGHAVILSGDGGIYLHTHPMEEKMKGMDHEATVTGSAAEELMKEGESSKTKAKGPDVIFHTNFPEAGLYKAWGQFQHKGKIIVAAFVLKVEPA